MDPEKTKRLMSSVKSGVDLETACHFAGYSVNEVYRWLERGKIATEQANEKKRVLKAEKECLVFWEELRTSRAEAIVRNVLHVQQAANNGSWQAATWWLERSAPELYSKNGVDKKLESTNQGGKAEIKGA